MRITTKIILGSIVFAWLLLASALAADKTAAQSDFEKLQEQVRAIDKDMALQKEIAAIKLDALEKRQNEITAQQSNSLALISNQTATVGNFIAITSIIVTLLVLSAGFITYFSATSKAKEEAREAAEKWFSENAVELKSQIDKLKLEAMTASAQIATHVDHVKSEADSASADMAAIRALGDSYIWKISKSGIAVEAVTSANPQATQIVRAASEALKTKPESDFTYQDFLTRGLNYFSVTNYESALSAFKSAYAALRQDTPVQEKVRLLALEAATLANLGRSEEAVVVYDDVDQRFGLEPLPGIRNIVATGLFNKGALLGKLGQSELALIVYENNDRRFGKDTDPNVLETVAQGLVNKGVLLGKLNNFEQEIAVYDDVDQRFGQHTENGLREAVAQGLINKGISLSKLGQFEREIAVYENLDLRFGKDTLPRVRQSLATGLFNKGVALRKLDRFEEEIAVYDGLVQRFGDDIEPVMREQVAKALLSKGFRLGKQDKFEHPSSTVKFVTC